MGDNIFQRMSQITQEITAVAKNLQVGYGSSKYNAVGEADILAAVKPIEAKHGVYSYPLSREIVESGTMEKETKTANPYRCICGSRSYTDFFASKTRKAIWTSRVLEMASTARTRLLARQ